MLLSSKSKINRWVTGILASGLIFASLFYWLPNTASAVTYTDIINDSFDRAATTAIDLGGDWWQPTAKWRIVTTGQAESRVASYAPLIVKDQRVKDTKSEITATLSATVSDSYQLLSRCSTVNHCIFMNYYLNASNSSGFYRIYAGDPNSVSTSSLLAERQIIDSDNMASITDVKMTMDVTSMGDNITEVSSKVMDPLNDDAVLMSLDSYTSLPEYQSAGMVGVGTLYGGGSYTTTLKDAKISAVLDTPEAYIYTTNRVIKLGQTNTFTVFSNSDQELNLTLSDGGWNGTFTPDSVTVAAFGSATFDYTPQVTGKIAITATTSGESTSTDLYVTPYSTEIGIMGDSISSPNTSATYLVQTLGAEFTFINRAISGYRITENWGTVHPTWGDTRQLTLDDFEANGVEVVEFMVGTNDLCSAGATVADTLAAYEGALQDFKNIGVKMILINYIPWRSAAVTCTDKIQAFNAGLYGLVDGETVFMGDNQAYDFFSANPTLLSDGLHPSDVGHHIYKPMVAEGYLRLIDGIGETMGQTWTGSTNDVYTKESLIGLEYTIDKDFTWFNVASGQFAEVLVDDSVVTPEDYAATSGSTIILLEPTYLDTLSVGTHVLTVRFNDGVVKSGAFNVLAANDNQSCSNGATNYPDCDDNPDIGNIAPNVPNTGLFGLSDSEVVVGLGLLAIVVVLGAAIFGRRLIKANR